MCSDQPRTLTIPAATAIGITHPWSSACRACSWTATTTAPAYSSAIAAYSTTTANRSVPVHCFVHQDAERVECGARRDVAHEPHRPVRYREHQSGAGGPQAEEREDHEIPGAAHSVQLADGGPPFGSERGEPGTRGHGAPRSDLAYSRNVFTTGQLNASITRRTRVFVAWTSDNSIRSSPSLCTARSVSKASNAPNPRARCSGRTPSRMNRAERSRGIRRSSRNQPNGHSRPP